MGEAVLVWQAAVAVSLIFARMRSNMAMVVVAWCWTLFTFAAVWASWLIALQLVTAWTTVWLLSKIPAKQIRSDVLISAEK